MDNVVLSEKTKIEDNTIYINRNIIKNMIERNEKIDNLRINIIYPDNHEMFINSILDFLPIATKVFGKPGEGITYEITGVKVMLTGVKLVVFKLQISAHQRAS